jgi:pimeloyl-[acyl-carrier protein] methyl ester esterase
MVEGTSRTTTSEHEAYSAGQESLKLVLLPGMDGTGDLLTEFVRFLPAWIVPQIVSYPANQKLSYTQIRARVQSVLPKSEPFAILAESFSSPLAVSIAANRPKNLKAVVICAGFVSPPIDGLPSLILRSLGSALFAFRAPDVAIRRYLVGKSAPDELVRIVATTVSTVAPGVLSHRLRAVLKCDVRDELRSVSVPLLFVEAAQDQLLRKRSVTDIKDAKPDATFFVIDGPHLILQTQPRKVGEMLAEFLRICG